MAGIAEDRTVGVDVGTDRVTSLEGVIVEGRIVGVDLVDGLQALTAIIRNTIGIDLFIVVVSCVTHDTLVHLACLTRPTNYGLIRREERKAEERDIAPPHPKSFGAF